MGRSTSTIEMNPTTSSLTSTEELLFSLMAVNGQPQNITFKLRNLLELRMSSEFEMPLGHERPLIYLVIPKPRNG